MSVCRWVGIEVSVDGKAEGERKKVLGVRLVSAALFFGVTWIVNFPGFVICAVARCCCWLCPSTQYLSLVTHTCLPCSWQVAVPIPLVTGMMNSSMCPPKPQKKHLESTFFQHTQQQHAQLLPTQEEQAEEPEQEKQCPHQRKQLKHQEQQW